MRQSSIPPAIVLLAAMCALPVAQAQQGGDAVDTASSSIVEPESATSTGMDDAGANAETGADIDTGTDADAPDPTSRSGFGQVMSVLTGLLQDAALREATGGSDGFALDNPAIEIAVTPAAGHTSLLRKTPAGTRVSTADRHSTGVRELAGGTPR